MAINVHSLKSFNVSRTVRCHLRYSLQSCNFGIFSRIEETDLDWDADIVKIGLPDLIKKKKNYVADKYGGNGEGGICNKYI